MMLTPPRSESEIFADLTSLCASPGYIHALGYLIFRDSVVTGGEEFKKEDFQKLYRRDRLIRTEISTLLGLWLKSDRCTDLPTADKMQEMIDGSDQLLAELHAAMIAPARAEFIAALEARQAGAEVESPLARASAMREAIFYSGESAFSSQYSDFARLRYAKDHEWLEAHSGIEIATAADMMEKLIKYFSDRFVPFFAELRSKPVDEWSLLPLFCFTENEIREVTGSGLQTVQAFIRTFAVADESRNTRFTNPFAFNEATVFPFVRVDETTYAMLQEYVGTEALYNAPSYWMRSDRDYAPKAASHRGQFAEDLTRDLIGRSFPDSRIHKNILFKRSKSITAGEADLILVQGKRAFVFQLKSKGLTELARSGNELAISQDFGAAVQAAYDQARLCIELLREKVPTFKGNQPYAISNLDDVEEFYPICITSENYPALSYQIGQLLKKAGGPGVNNPIIMDIFTLDVITEFLRSPLYLVDYLSKRSLVSDRVLSAHEMILFSYHLKGNLFVPADVGLLMVEDDFLCDLDLAMNVRRRGLPGAATPPGILTRDLDNPLGRILAGVDKSDRPDVHQLGELILNLSGKTWDTINGWIRGLAAQGRSDGKSHDVTVPLDNDRIGLTIHCNDLPEREAFEKLATHCEVRKYAHKSDRWFGVCLSAAREDVRFALGRIGPWEYVAELEEEAATLKVRSVRHWVDASGRRGAKPGRNSPCPCGSGRKYKRCHGAN